jgi:hypothetical protein
MKVKSKVLKRQRDRKCTGERGMRGGGNGNEKDRECIHNTLVSS